MLNLRNVCLIMLNVEFSDKLNDSGINLQIATLEIKDLSMLKKQYDFSPQFNLIIKEIKEKYTLENIKGQKLISLYRKFYWEHLKLDPTKIRPAAEALIRRILSNKAVPQISPFVDAYNWASIKSLVPMGAYDHDSFIEPLIIRLTEENEKFTPIAQEAKTLPSGILITSDAKKRILCQYPYRDSQETMIQDHTKNIVLIAYGIKGFEQKDLLDSIDFAKKNLNWFAENEILSIYYGNIQLWKN